MFVLFFFFQLYDMYLNCYMYLVVCSYTGSGTLLQTLRIASLSLFIRPE